MDPPVDKEARVDPPEDKGAGVDLPEDEEVTPPAKWRRLRVVASGRVGHGGHALPGQAGEDGHGLHGL